MQSMDGWMVGWMDGWMDGWLDGWMDGCEWEGSSTCYRLTIALIGKGERWSDVTEYVDFFPCYEWERCVKCG